MKMFTRVCIETQKFYTIGSTVTAYCFKRPYAIFILKVLAMKYKEKHARMFWSINKCLFLRQRNLSIVLFSSIIMLFLYIALHYLF